METVLPTGATMRLRGAPAERVVLMLPGGFARPPSPRWGATTQYLSRTLAADGVAVAEVRFRQASWTTLQACHTDAGDALDRLQADGVTSVLVCGFSMGGAVAVAVAGHPVVRQVVGLAPWLPDSLDLEALRARRTRVFHGSLDTDRRGIPGVPPAQSRRAVARGRELGLDIEHTTIVGGLHGAALGVAGHLLPLPRAAAWRRAVAGEAAVLLGRG